MEPNDKIVVIHQPDFMPYLGFFHRFLIADIYIILDNVQFVSSSRSMNNRDKIKTEKGEKWITIPVNKCPRDTNINEVTISSANDWRRTHLITLQNNYGRAPYFKEIYPSIEILYNRHATLLIDFTLESIRLLMKLFNVEIPTVLSSDLNVAGTSNERIANLVKAVGANRYLSGVGAKAYFDPELYKRKGVEVIWQDFTHPVYPQLHDGFIPFLSSLDLLFNCGVDESRKILRRCLK